LYDGVKVTECVGPKGKIEDSSSMDLFLFETLLPAEIEV
jgi:hypothetical protein